MSKGYNKSYSTYLFTMLITAIQFICSHDNDFSRRDVLIETLKNADKHARFEERLTFLCECRRSDLYPKFIQFDDRKCVHSYLLSFIKDIDLRGGCLHSQVSRVLLI